MVRHLKIVLRALSCLAFTVAVAHAERALDNEQLPRPAPWQTEIVGALPADEALEKLGARIGRVEVQVDDVFESATSLAVPYRLANGLHIPTRPDTIRAQMLFRSGDAYSRRQLEETARLLRTSRYLNEATVEPVRYNDDNTVDVVVRVHDVWTLSPGLSFGRKGGENSTKLKFEDTNFLGFGKQLAVSRSDDVDRSAWRFAYTDPNVLGTWWKLSGAYASLSDGSENQLAISRPFYSLDTRWGFDSLAADTTSAASRYGEGKIVEQFQMQEQQFEIGGGVSSGLQDGWVRRYLAGVRYDNRAFSTRPGHEDVSLPEDRVVAYPWVGVELIEDQYMKTRNLDQIGRTEDLYLGRSARLEVGFASSAFGSTRDALVLNGALQAAAEPGADQYLINTLAFRSRLDGGALRNTQLDLDSRYYLRQSLRSVLFAAASASFTEKLDAEEQLLLGGDNGLRGYPLRYQAGTTRALFTLEERFYSNWQPLKLFNVGAAVFFDAGRTWGRDEFAGESLGWLKDVGVGLRLGSARSGLGNVLHIDLALPLDGGRDIDSMQFLIETRRSF